MRGEEDRIQRHLQIAVQQKLISLYQSGMRHVRRIPRAEGFAAEVPQPGGSIAPTTTAARSSSRTAGPARIAPPPATGPVARPRAIDAESPGSSTPSRLDVLRREVAACTACSELVSNRTQTVFGVGDPQARLCFLGEAPGADEDRLGEPFVGRAGQLLDRILAACTLRRDEVFILNVLKCRPPGNRNPAADEVAHCRFFFEKQLEIIAPEFICCLGGVAAQALLQTTESVGKLRGQFHDYRNSKVVVTYHPAYLLRSPDQKKKTWEDMKMLMRAMGIEIPSR